MLGVHADVQPLSLSAMARIKVQALTPLFLRQKPTLMCGYVCVSVLTLHLHVMVATKNNQVMSDMLD
ncbi:MAG: hypothetical protein ACJAZ4_002339 [Neptuniibacter pectenicola]|jgi:hypothetical protein